MEEEKKTNPVGRPTDYTSELAEQICEEIENTPRGLEYICEQHEHFPAARTVRRWVRQLPEFRHVYAQAKTLQAQRMADETMEIANDDKRDWRTIIDVNGIEKTVFVPEAVNRSRLKIDTLKWQAETLDAHMYGNKKQEKDDSGALESAITAMKEIAEKCLQTKS